VAIANLGPGTGKDRSSIDDKEYEAQTMLPAFPGLGGHKGPQG
jgi:hypothetical protein